MQTNPLAENNVSMSGSVVSISWVKRSEYLESAVFKMFSLVCRICCEDARFYVRDLCRVAEKFN